MSSILVLLFPFKDSHSAFEVFCSGSSVFLDAVEVNQWRADVHDEQKDDIIGWRNHRADYTKSLQQPGKKVKLDIDKISSSSFRFGFLTKPNKIFVVIGDVFENEEIKNWRNDHIRSKN